MDPHSFDRAELSRQAVNHALKSISRPSVNSIEASIYAILAEDTDSYPDNFSDHDPDDYDHMTEEECDFKLAQIAGYGPSPEINSITPGYQQDSDGSYDSDDSYHSSDYETDSAWDSDKALDKDFRIISRNGVVIKDNVQPPSKQLSTLYNGNHTRDINSMTEEELDAELRSLA